METHLVKIPARGDNIVPFRSLQQQRHSLEYKRLCDEAEARQACRAMPSAGVLTLRPGRTVSAVPVSPAIAIDLTDQLAEAEFQRAVADHLKREARKLIWQRRVKWFAIMVAYAALVYFSFQIGRGL